MIGKLARMGRTEVVTAAPPEAVWRILADVTRVGEWSHECRGARWLGPVREPAPGVRFRGTNRSGWIVWQRTCEFTVVDEPKLLAWKTTALMANIDSTEWRMYLEPIRSGTRIVQTYEVIHAAPGVDRLFWLIVKAHRDRRDALDTDLVRLAALAERECQQATNV